MAEIEIPFQERFREAMLDGTKTCTARTKRYGRPGDIFRAFGATFQLTSIVVIELRVVAKHFWEREGAKSQADFIEIWENLHPRKGYDPDRRVHHHWFMRVGRLPDAVH